MSSGPAPLRTDEGLAYRLSDEGLPIGIEVPDWTPRPPVEPTQLSGRYVRLEAWDATRHARGLFAALHAGTREQTERRWTYIPCGPFDTETEMVAWLDGLRDTPGVWPLIIVAASSTEPASPEATHATEAAAPQTAAPQILGTASYLRTNQAAGTTEVGWIVYSPDLQRTRAATEAMFLMAHHALHELGYRRYQWKCDALNAPSRAAAARLGFTFEGIWRQAAIYKGRNRDTAWFAMTDTDWAQLLPRYETWLAPENFTADGLQRQPLNPPR